MPGWDSNAATFEMTIVANNLHGDYQLANGYGHDRAKEVLKVKPYVANIFSLQVSVIVEGSNMLPVHLHYLTVNYVFVMNILYGDQ